MKSLFFNFYDYRIEFITATKMWFKTPRFAIDSNNGQSYRPAYPVATEFSALSNLSLSIDTKTYKLLKINSPLSINAIFIDTICNSAIGPSTLLTRNVSDIHGLQKSLMNFMIDARPSKRLYLVRLNSRSYFLLDEKYAQVAFIYHDPTFATFLYPAPLGMIINFDKPFDLGVFNYEKDAYRNLYPYLHPTNPFSLQRR